MVGSKSFDQVQIKLFWTNFYDLDLSQMISTCPKQKLVLDQNDLNSPKLFEPIEGQGIKLLIKNEGKLGQVQCIQGVRTLNAFFFFILRM